MILESLKGNQNKAFEDDDLDKYTVGPLKYIIIDCSSFTFLDLPSTEALLKVSFHLMINVIIITLESINILL